MSAEFPNDGLVLGAWAVLAVLGLVCLAFGVVRAVRRRGAARVIATVVVVAAGTVSAAVAWLSVAGAGEAFEPGTLCNYEAISMASMSPAGENHACVVSSRERVALGLLLFTVVGAGGTVAVGSNRAVRSAADVGAAHA